MSNTETPPSPRAIDGNARIFSPKFISDHLIAIYAGHTALFVVLLVLLFDWMEPSEFDIIEQAIGIALKLVLVGFIVRFVFCIGRRIQLNEEIALQVTIQTDVEAQKLTPKLCERNYGSISDAASTEKL
jgi:hypothetical protein